MKQPFEIISKNDMYAIKNESSVVAIVVYSLDEEGLLDKIGLVTEDSPHFQAGKYTGLVMGKVEKNDPSLLYRAKRETIEESGYDIQDTEKWFFLGELYTSKIFPEPIYCYAVDVTGANQGKVEGDGSSHESTLKFDLVSLKEAQKVNDSILLSCIFKLFLKLYKSELNISNDQTDKFNKTEEDGSLDS